MDGPHSSGQYSGGPLFSNHQQAVWNTVKTLPELALNKRDLLPMYSADMLLKKSQPMGFVRSTRRSPSITIPSILLAQSCLTYVNGVSNMAQSANLCPLNHFNRTWPCFPPLFPVPAWSYCENTFEGIKPIAFVIEPVARIIIITAK